MVQKIHRVRADGETLALVDSDLLAERRIDAEVCRSFKPALACVTGESRAGILKKDISGAIHDNLVGETARDGCVAAKVRKGRDRRLEVFEVFDVTVADLDLPEIRKCTDQI